MRFDLHHELEFRRLISPDEGAGSDTAKVSQKIDLANVNACTIVIATGTLADTDATFTALLEDSPDNTTFTPVADGFLLGTEAGASFTFAADDAIRKLSYIGPQRYLRLTITPADNTGAWDICAIAVLSHHRKGLQTSQS